MRSSCGVWPTMELFPILLAALCALALGPQEINGVGCYPVSCKNGATCQSTDHAGAPICTCAFGWSGTYCDEAIKTVAGCQLELFAGKPSNLDFELSNYNKFCVDRRLQLPPVSFAQCARDFYSSASSILTQGQGIAFHPLLGLVFASSEADKSPQNMKYYQSTNQAPAMYKTKNIQVQVCAAPVTVPCSTKIFAVMFSDVYANYTAACVKYGGGLIVKQVTDTCVRSLADQTREIYDNGQIRTLLDPEQSMIQFEWKNAAGQYVHYDAKTRSYVTTTIRTATDSFARFPALCVDVDECQATTCKNGGSCTNTKPGFYCSCILGFTGDNCEYNSLEGKCSSTVCKHDGLCIQDSDDFFSCDCLPTSQGLQCENDVDECLLLGVGTPGSSPYCNSRGRCMNRDPGFKCDCELGYTGDQCESEDPWAATGK